MNPRAGGAAVAIWGECQRPRKPELGKDPKSAQFDAPFLRSPLFWRCFFLILPLKSHRTDSKSRCQKKGQTHRQTDRFEPISRSAGSRFQTLETLLPLGEALKRGSRIKLPDSLNIPTNGHLRLPRSLALSSNCACGAKTRNWVSRDVQLFIKSETESPDPMFKFEISILNTKSWPIQPRPNV